jgi:hypothetical protein
MVMVVAMSGLLTTLGVERARRLIAEPTEGAI